MYREKVKWLRSKIADASGTEEIATIKRELARTYELMDGCGQAARDAYEDIVKNHQGYSRASDVHMRLGNLYDYVELPGTKPDHEKALSHYKSAVEKSNPSTIRHLQARLAYGILLWHRGKPELSRHQFEAVYRSNAVPVLEGEDEKLPQKLRDERLKAIQDDHRQIRDKALGLFVAAHRDRDPAKTLLSLDQLEARCGGDPLVLELIGKEREKMQQVGQQMLPQLNRILRFPN
jgi:TPR repeat protein